MSVNNEYIQFIVTKIQKLVEELNENNLKYCHWKSNYLIAETLSGRTDIDLLIDRRDANQFRSILSQLGFKPATTTNGDPFPSIEHHFALDEESGILAHIHAYFRVITGDSLTKNYRFPIENMLLENTRVINSLRLPVKSAELIVFTLRMMLKHTSLVELLLLSRYWKLVQREINWLMEEDPIDETIDLLRCYLPSLDTNLFLNCVAAIKTPAPLYRRVILGHRLRAQLGLYARHSILRARLEGIRKFIGMFFRRSAQSRKNMVLRNGGAMIAFVGSEATGKSTLIEEMRTWLGKQFAVRQIHVGKPPSTMFTIIPNLFLPVLRALFPGARTTQLDTFSADRDLVKGPPSRFPLLFAIRSVLLSHDRNALLLRAFRQASNGIIVLCDRYPSLTYGAPDSPQLSLLPISTGRNYIRRLLANIEARLYRQIPPPDLVIYLTAPITVTINRNATRGKNEPEDYVRRRHARSSNLEFGRAPIHQVNTDQPFDQTVLEVKKAIWAVL